MLKSRAFATNQFRECLAVDCPGERFEHEIFEPLCGSESVASGVAGDAASSMPVSFSSPGNGPRPWI